MTTEKKKKDNGLPQTTTLENALEIIKAEKEPPKTIRFCEGMSKTGKIVSKRLFFNDNYAIVDPETSSRKISEAIVNNLGYYHWVNKRVPMVPSGFWYNSYFTLENKNKPQQSQPEKISPSS
jgi:hypothetical protein